MAHGLSGMRNGRKQMKIGYVNGVPRGRAKVLVSRWIIKR